MSELRDKVNMSIERLKAFEPEEGYYLAFSGGKDSVVTKAIADLAGVKYHAHYRITTVDPPELVRFIKEKYPDVSRDAPRYAEDYKNPKLAGKVITMWNLIPEKMMPPTRIARYCCEKLKEDGGDGGIAVTGVRWAESVNRKKNQGAVVIHGDFRQEQNPDQIGLFDQPEGIDINERHGSLILTNDNADNRRLVEHCFRRRKITVNPIIEWTDEDVWEFIKIEHIPYCELYECGFTRLGCIGCPMAGTKEREREFAMWPKYKHHYMLAFARMLEKRKERNKEDPTRPIWRNAYTSDDMMDPTAQDVFDWWMEYYKDKSWLEDYKASEENDD